MRILTRGSKNNTYKFALARFLLDYSNSSDAVQIRYSVIAKYFFRYYWLQECKSKLLQGPSNQQPEIITIIRMEFTGEEYPYTFKELEKKEPAKIQRCVERITKKCFDDVVPRFQEKEKIFFDYLAKAYNDSADNKKIDPGGGIRLNPDAMRYFKDNHDILFKAVILEWVRFLETRNLGMPRLVSKIEANDISPRDQAKFRRLLESFTHTCFYCKDALEPDKTHVDHVIPYDYIGDTELWNLVLACQECNCRKLNNLPPKKYIENLKKRNVEHATLGQMEKSLHSLNHGTHDIDWHYGNAKRHNYKILVRFPMKR